MAQPVRIGVYGASGSGKSTKAEELIRNAPRVIAFDPMDEWRRHGFATVPAARFRDALLRHWNDRPLRLAVIPSYGQEAQDLHHVSDAIKDAQERTGGRAPITLVADELNTAFPVTSLPSELQGFGWLCSRGRHVGVSIIGVTQRIAEVNTRWRGNTSGFYLFRQADARDLATANGMILPQFKRDLAGLRNFEFLYVEAGRVLRGMVKPKR